MLELADPAKSLHYKFNSAQLKTLLRERGLKISGAKDELVLRLIENDPAGIQKISSDSDLFQCTPSGSQMAEIYLETMRSKRMLAEKEILDRLGTGEFPKAVNLLVQYEASQIFPRGLGVDWNNFDKDSEIESLKVIFSRTPEILRDVEVSRLGNLRIAAGMMQLFGTNSGRQWLPKDFETGIHLKSDTACRMLLFHASHLRSMKTFLEAGIGTVRVLGSGDSCSQCREISGRKFALGDAPELPLGKCIHELGCRCIAQPDY